MIPERLVTILRFRIAHIGLLLDNTSQPAPALAVCCSDFQRYIVSFADSDEHKIGA